MKTREADGPAIEPHPSHQEMLASYVDLTRRMAEELGTLNEQRWTAKGQFRMKGRIALEQPVRDILGPFHFDVIHHRGQLITYLRPLGSRVLSIYGKSGDDAGSSGHVTSDS